MDAAISLQDVANIVTFIAPGYFAIQVYSLIYAKREREFSRLLVESVVYSLPLVFITNFLWENILHRPHVDSLNLKYSALLFAVSLGFGALSTYLRVHWPVNAIAAKLGLGSPDEDFIKTQLLRLKADDPDKNVVTVTLKDGKVFSGTVNRLSRYAHNGPKHYCFANLAWYNQKTKRWEEREGSLIIEREEIQYIETPKLKDA
jgi:hypothetical protein